MNGKFKFTMFLGNLLAVVILFSTVMPASAQPFETQEPVTSAQVSSSVVEVFNTDNNYFLKVDLQDPRVHIRAGLANNDVGGYSTLTSMKNRYDGKGYSEWAIINGDLFGSGCPSNVNCAQGLTYIDGSKRDSWSQYGNTWMVRGNLGIDSVNKAQISVGDEQTKRNMIIGGGPRIVIGGGSVTCNGELVNVDGNTKTYFPASGEYFDGDVRWWCTDTRAITLVGYSADGRYMFMGISKGGKTVVQLAQWLKDRGAQEILRLDSGSSSGMYHTGAYVGGTVDKPIANHLALVVDNSSPPPPTPPPGDWNVEYFNDPTITSKCAGTLTAKGPYVFNDWGDGTPHPNCNSDYWSARFWKTVHFKSGTYQFGLGSDDWSRLKIGEDLVLDNWQGAGQHYASRMLTEGDYQITVEFADTLGGARLSAWWWGPDYPMPRETRDQYQWYAQYWGNKGLWWDAIIQTNEGTGPLNHQWVSNGPGYGLPVDQFSSRFERNVYFTCGTYEFDISTDDGVRFWVDDIKRLDAWYDHVGNHPANVSLSEGYHELKIEHYDNGGGAHLGLDWTQLTTCLPNPPSNLTATAVSQSQIDLAWTDNSGNEAGFKLEHSSDGSNAWTQIATLGANATGYSDAGLNSGTAYFYRVRAFNTTGDSAYSNTANATTQSLPAAPSDLAATAVSPSEIDLAWTDNSNDEEGFELERSSDGSTGWTKIASLGANVTHYFDAGLSSGTSYYYRVRTFSASGYSPNSNVVSARTIGTIFVPQDYPTITQALAAAQDGDTVQISAGIYYERISVNPGVKLVGENPQETIIDGGGVGTVVYLNGDATISGFTIRNSGAEHWDAGIWISDGASLVSQNSLTGNSMGIVFYCWSPCSGQPRIENNIVYNNRSDGILAHDGTPRIANNTIVGNGINGIAVDRSGTIVKNNISAGNAFGGIRGNNADLLADYNNVWNNLHNYYEASLGAHDHSADPGFVSSSPGGFRLRSDSPNIDAATNVEGIATDIDGEDRPYDGDGDGTAQADIGADEYVGPPLLLPDAPSNLFAAAVSVSEIDLTWTDNSGNEDGFELERSPEGITGWTSIATLSADTTGYTDTGLVSGNTYYYRVRAFNAAGYSPYSNLANVRTQSLSSAPSNLMAEAVSASQIDLAWTDQSNDEDGFQLERSLDGSSGWTAIAALGANVTGYSDTGLGAETAYYYRVRAFNTTGNSPYTDVAYALTLSSTSNEGIAFGEIVVAGAVNGSYLDTQGDDGIAQSITEVESDGKPAKRYSFLEHKWQFSVQAGEAIAFHANVWVPASSDSDRFVFAYSADDAAYVDMFEVAAASGNDGSYHFSLPGMVSGTVYIRVRDTDRTAGNRSLDTIYIDHLFIQAGSAPSDPPAAPTGLTATAEGASRINLSWMDNATNESGYEIERSIDSKNWELIDSVAVDMTTFSDTGLSANTTYYYRVRATNNAETSIYSNTANATTADDSQPVALHIGDLDASSTTGSKSRWDATVSVLVHQTGEEPVAGATVSGSWIGAVTGNSTCTTDASGQCTLTKANIKSNLNSVTFSITDVALGSSFYQSYDNHDPDGDSDGNSITVGKP